MIRFAQFDGALIAALLTPMALPTNLDFNDGEIVFYLAPILQISGLILLVAAPKPPKKTLADKKGKERLIFEHRFPGHGKQTLAKQTLMMLTQFFSFEALAVMPFVLVKAFYVAFIESSF